MAKVAVRRSVTRLVYDSFTGSGALTAHTPDVAPVGSSWAILNGSFADLADGRLSAVPGANHVAIIDAGTANCEVQALCRARISGIVFRSNADATNRFVLQLETEQNKISLFTYTDLTAQTGTTSSALNSVPQTNGNDYLITIYLRNQLMRFFVDGVYEWDYWTTNYQTNTYHGVGAQSWSTGWDNFTVRPAETWKRILTFGDSISMHTVNLAGSAGDNHNAVFSNQMSVGAMWDAWVGAGYNNGRTLARSYAVGGANIYGDADPTQNFAYQISVAAAAEEVTPDMIFCEFGVNDVHTLPNITTEYQACLQSIKTAWPGVPIYCLGVLGTTGYRDYNIAENVETMDAKIEAAAIAEGATFWRTFGWLDMTTDSNDGVHPNRAGNAKLGAAVLARL